MSGRGLYTREIIMNRRLSFLILLILIVPLGALLTGDEKEDILLAPNRVDEPLAEEYSAARAESFLDEVTRSWETSRRCVTCHTNGLYLVAKSFVAPKSDDLARAREFAHEYLAPYVTGEKEPSGQRGSLEGVVATTAFLAIADAQADGRLDPRTIRALDHVWGLQSEDGDWSTWLQCNWPPYEVDAHFGATLIALAVAMAPKESRGTKAARRGIARLRRHLRTREPANLHQTGMLLWVAHHDEGLATRRRVERWVRALTEVQRDDGGFATRDLGDERWVRQDGSEQDEESDAYATAFVSFVLSQVPAGLVDAEVTSAAHAWLEAHQRDSGRWFARSPRRDGHHFLSHAATAFAVMALAPRE